MKKLLLLLTSLSLLHSTQAEMLEGNVTLQLKFTRQVLVQQTATSLTTKWVTSTYKNADFIQHMSAIKGGTAFSKAAKIIYQLSNEGTSFYIRDKSAANDYPVTNHLAFSITGDTIITSQKITFEAVDPFMTKMGAEKHMSLGTVSLAVANPANEKNIHLDGIFNYNVRNVRSKLNTERTFGLPTLTFTGNGRFIFPIAGEPAHTGLTQGSMKISGVKVVPSPAVPEGL